MDTSQNINSRQLRAVELLASGTRCSDVAKELGVSRETISRWKREPAFKAALNCMHNDTKASVIERMRRLTSKSLDTLTAILEDETAPARVRAETAWKVLEVCGVQNCGMGGGAEDEAGVVRTRKKSAEFAALFNLG